MPKFERFETDLSEGESPVRPAAGSIRWKDGLPLIGGNPVDPFAKTGTYLARPLYGSVDEALAYAELFHPEFFVLDGIIFIGGFADSLREGREGLQELLGYARRKGRKEVQDLAELHNQVELFYLFSTQSGAGEKCERFALVLAKVWQNELNTTFPESRCRVVIKHNAIEHIILSILQEI